MLRYGVNRQSLVAPLASWFRTSGRFQRLVSNARVLSGPVRVLVSNGRVPSAPVRVLLGSRFQCSGPTPRLEFYIDNTMRGGVGGVKHEICKIIFGNCSNVVVQRWFQTGRRQCTRAHTQRQRTALKGEVLEIDCHTRTPLLSL